MKNDLLRGAVPVDSSCMPPLMPSPVSAPHKAMPQAPAHPGRQSLLSPSGGASTSELRFIDLFAGLGGFRLAFERQGGRCVFSSEWDRFARESYHANFAEIPAGDIREIEASSIPDFDILCAGFPCQPFSLAGVSKKNSLGRKHGFLDESQGTLFFDIARIIEAKRPRAFLLENVKHLKNHDKGRTFDVIIRALDELGYHLKTDIINASDYLPQNRARIFIAGFLDEKAAAGFSFPIIADSGKQRVSLRDILERKVDPKYELSDKLWRYLQDYRKKHEAAGNGFGYGLIRDRNAITRTLSARYYKDGSEILLPMRGRNPRRLTPRECARLQGYPEDYRIVVSDTQAYKQFGNSVAVPVVTAIAERMAIALKAKKSRKRSARNSYSAAS